MINFIDGVSLSKLCDYSFGDQASIICNIDGGYMKKANLCNTEFISKLQEIKKQRKYMTLFIDNIRLYKRDLNIKNLNDKIWIDNLMNDNDLLNLCSHFSEMNFIIFCNLEDSPIDNFIEGKIPSNVLGIYAANAVFNNDKVHPFPYGIQRKMNFSDQRYDILKNKINNSIIPKKLLYINHNINTNYKERHYIYDLFKDKPWATPISSNLEYENFINNILNHKFMICPVGNAIDCHRNWEVLYLKRVPIMLKNNYLELLFKDFPVLFVEKFSDVTEDLLLDNENVFNLALNLNLDKLNLEKKFTNIVKSHIC